MSLDKLIAAVLAATSNYGWINMSQDVDEGGCFCKTSKFGDEFFIVITDNGSELSLSTWSLRMGCPMESLKTNDIDQVTEFVRSASAIVNRS